MEKMPTSIIEKIPDSIKSEHLKKGESPIMVCLGLPDDAEIRSKIRELVYGKGENSDTHNVNYFEDIDILEAKKFKNAGRKTYVISIIDNKNKFTDEIRDCTALVASGRDKKTGENISFLSHQDPDKFLHDAKDEFNFDLNKQLSELKERSEIGTVDIIIVGGNYYYSRDFRESYLDSIKLLTQQTKAVFGFEPVVVGGPKVVYKSYTDTVYYDNINKRLYLIRLDPMTDETNEFHPPFINKNIDEEERKWIK